MNDSEQWTGRHVEESGKQVISRPLPVGCWGKPRTPAMIAGLTSNNLSWVQHTQSRRTRVKITFAAGVPTLVQPVPFDTRSEILRHWPPRRWGITASRQYRLWYQTQNLFPRCYAFMDPPPPVAAVTATHVLKTRDIAPAANNRNSSCPWTSPYTSQRIYPSPSTQRFILFHWTSYTATCFDR